MLSAQVRQAGLAFGLLVAGAATAFASGAGSDFSATAGQQYSGPVATLQNEASASDAQIDWGDGGTSAGTVRTTATHPGAAPTYDFAIDGQHTYSSAGTYTVAANAIVSGRPETYTATATVAAGDDGGGSSGRVISASGRTLAAGQGVPLSGVLAHFTDAAGGTKASDYAVSIAWGDGRTSPGTVVAADGGYNVTGDHRYITSGPKSATITIAQGSRSATTVATIDVAAAPNLVDLKPPKVGRLKVPAKARPKKKLRFELPATARTSSKKVALQIWNWRDKKPVDRTLSGITFSAGEPQLSDKPITHDFSTKGVKFVQVHTYDVNGALTITGKAMSIASDACDGDPTPPSAQADAYFVAYEPGVVVDFDGTNSTKGLSGCGKEPAGETRKYLWDFGDGAKSALAKPQHTFGYGKHYAVKLTVKTPTGQSSVTIDIHTPENKCEAFDVRGIRVFQSSGCMTPVPFGTNFAYVSGTNTVLDVNGVIMSRQGKRMFISHQFGSIANWPIGEEGKITAIPLTGTSLVPIGSVETGFSLPKPDASGTSIVEFDPNPSFEVGGLHLAGAVAIHFHTDKAADVVFRFAPPPPLVGSQIEIPPGADLTQPFQIDMPDMWFGPARAHGLHFTRYPSGAMSGTGGLEIAGLADLSAGFEFGAGGVFQSASAAYDPDPAIPIFPLFAMNHIGASIQASPFTLQGDIGVISTASVGGLSLLSGHACFNMAVAGVGDQIKHWCDSSGSPTGTFTETVSGPRLHMTGSMSAFGGYVSLGTAALDANTKEFALSANAGAKLEWPKGFKIASASATISGWGNTSGAFQAAADAQLCAFDWCRGGQLLVSDKGAAGCASVDFWVGSVNMGAWVRWDFSDGGLVFAGCDVHDTTHVAHSRQLPRYDLRAEGDSVLGGVAQTTFKLKNDAPAHVIEITGQQDTPHLKITGPGGKVYTDTGTNAIHSKQGYAFLHAGAQRKTFAVLYGKPAGTYTVTTTNGVTIAGLAQARTMAAPKVSAQVKGSGRHRTLKYNADLVKGDSLAFYERSKSVAGRIGTAKEGSGALSFTPARGKAGERKVYAIVTRNGVPRRMIKLDTYEAPAPPPVARPAAVKARVNAGKLTVSWPAAAGAKRYLVDITLSDGRRLRYETKSTQRSLTVPGILAGTRVSASVRTVDADGRYSGGRSDKLDVPKRVFKATI